MKVTITYRPFEGDISGMLFRDSEQRVIGVNSLQNRTRQRFTIAHELGHLMLHPGRQLVVDRSVLVNLRDKKSSLAVDTHEIEANALAAELLMPTAVLTREIGRLLKKRVKDIQRLTRVLATSFDVSVKR